MLRGLPAVSSSVLVAPFIGAFLLACVVLAAPLRAEQTPQMFLSDLQAKVVEQLTGAQISENEREARFRKLFKTHFDTETISRFVLGRHWKRANEAEQAEFQQVFEDIMVQRFLPILADSTDVAFNFGEAKKDSRADDMFLVLSHIPRQGAEPYKVVWRVKSANASYRILDIVPEGVSMALTFRSEYGSFIKANGGDVGKLVAELRRKLNRGAFRSSN